MRAARCGSPDCVDHKVCHSGDTACVIYRRNGIQNNKWLVDPNKKKISGFGGWHDAGDYLKFSLTVGYTAYFLLKAYEVNPDIFTKKQSKTDLVDVLDARINNNSDFREHYHPELLGGINMLEGEGLKLIPYYAWANRDIGKMNVWFNR